MGKKIQGREFERRMKCISLNKAGSGVIYCGGHTPQDVKDTAINIAKEADARIAALEAERDRLREALEANMPVIEAAEEIGNNSLAVQTCLHRVKDGEGEEFEYLIADLAEALADRDSRYAARQALQPKEQL